MDLNHRLYLPAALPTKLPQYLLLLLPMLLNQRKPPQQLFDHFPFTGFDADGHHLVREWSIVLDDTVVFYSGRLELPRDQTEVSLISSMQGISKRSFGKLSR